MTFEGPRHKWRLGRFSHDAVVALNPGPAWDLDFSLGAARVEMDLSSLIVDRLKLENGAARTTIRLGNRGKETGVDIQAGASSIRIEVPEAAGCEVHVEAPISSKKFPGFMKTGDGEYRTENYSTAQSKISISINAGVSSIKVTRY